MITKKEFNELKEKVDELYAELIIKKKAKEYLKNIDEKIDGHLDNPREIQVNRKTRRDICDAKIAGHGGYLDTIVYKNQRCITYSGIPIIVNKNLQDEEIKFY